MCDSHQPEAGADSAPAVQSIDAADDDTIAVVRYVYTTPDNDVPESKTTVYAGGLEEVKTAINHDSEGDDDTIIEEVGLMYVSPDHFSQELGFVPQVRNNLMAAIDLLDLAYPFVRHVYKDGKTVDIQHTYPKSTSHREWFTDCDVCRARKAALDEPPTPA